MRCLRPSLPGVVRVCLWLTILLPLAARGAGDAPLRLAVVGGPGVEAEAALVSAECSRTGGFTLVERDEIARVVAERRLPGRGLAGVEPAGFGPWLGADGILILERAPDGALKSPLRGRLVAARSGVVLWAFAEPMPMPEPAHWAANTARRLAGWVPKLAVRREEAVPISLLGLHAALRGDGPLEEALDDLLALRLGREPSVFVLERRRMEELGFEKPLLGTDDPFWTGARVLEGTVTREGKRVAVEAVLRPPPGPGHGEPQRLQASAGTPLGVIEQLAAQMGKLLGPDRMGTAAWNPAAEAGLFEQEAVWALRWNLPGRAERAGETAWALGGRSVALGQARALAYALDGGAGGVSHSLFDPAHFPAPAPRHLAALLRAFDAYAEPPLPAKVETQPERRSRLTHGCILLESASRLLRAYAVNVNRIPEPEAMDLRTLRGRVRELALALARDTDATPEMDSFFLGAGYSLLAPATKTDGQVNVYWLISLHGGLWLDRPEDVAAIFGTLLDKLETLSPPQENSLVHGPLTAWIDATLVRAWRRDDADGLQRAWETFLDAGCRSPRPRRRLYARLLRLGSWLRSDGLGRRVRCPAGAVNDLLDDLERSFAEFPRAGVSPGLMTAALHGPAGTAARPYGDRRNQDFPWNRYDEVCRKLVTGFLDSGNNGDLWAYVRGAFRTSAYPPELRPAAVAQIELAKGNWRRQAGQLTDLQQELGAQPPPPEPPSPTAEAPDPALSPVATLAVAGKVEAVVWAGDRLWVQSCQREDGQRDEVVTFAPFSLPDGRAGSPVSLPRPHAATDNTHALITSWGRTEFLPRFTVLGGDPFVLGEPETLRRYDAARGEWQRWAVPGARAGGIWAVGRWLYLSGEDGVLLRVNPRDGTTELLASARRRPATNLLEDTPSPPHVVRVFDAGADRLGIVLEDARVLVCPEAERPLRLTQCLLPFNTPRGFTFDPTLLRRAVGGGGRCVTYPLTGFAAALLLDLDRSGNVSEPESTGWPLPLTFLPGYPPGSNNLMDAAWDGEQLWAVFGVYAGAALGCYHPGGAAAPDARRLPLPAEGQPDPSRVCATPHGPVCYADGGSVVLLFPPR